MSLSIIELVEGLTELENDTTGRKRLYSFNIPNGECIMTTEERGYFITDGTYLGRSVGEAMRSLLDFPWAHSAIWELGVLEEDL